MLCLMNHAPEGLFRLVENDGVRGLNDSDVGWGDFKKPLLMTWAVHLFHLLMDALSCPVNLLYTLGQIPGTVYLAAFPL
jgi:hypothetical protein